MRYEDAPSFCAIAATLASASDRVDAVTLTDCAKVEKDITESTLAAAKSLMFFLINSSRQDKWLRDIHIISC